MQLTLTSGQEAWDEVALSGDVGQSELPPGEDLLAQLLGPECYRRCLLLDLSGVTALDSSGVGWLLGCQKRFHQRGGRMVLHSLSPVVRTVTVPLQIHLILAIAEDPAKAREMIAAASPSGNALAEAGFISRPSRGSRPS